MGLKIAYIHGFLSSSRARKAGELRRYMAEHHPTVTCLAPDFPELITEALPCLEEFCSEELRSGPLCLVGSSMGGFIATLLSIKFGLKVCLFNPCIHPQHFVRKLLGQEQFNPDTGRRFYLTEDLVEKLTALDEYALSHHDPALIRVFVESGDEVLDYREALRFFSHCEVEVTEGGEHGFLSFESKLEQVLQFFSAA